MKLAFVQKTLQTSGSNLFPFHFPSEKVHKAGCTSVIKTTADSTIYRIQRLKQYIFVTSYPQKLNTFVNF